MGMNLVFILSDDQGAWALGCAGNKDIQTPHLDALATQGVRFDNFYCASPVCSPARASILTGRIPSQHGIHDWLAAGNVGSGQPDGGTVCGGIGYTDGMTGYTDLLKKAGYRVAFSGKWHLGESAQPQHGNDDWYVISGGGANYMHMDFIRDGKWAYEDGYGTDLITDHALAMLDKLAEGDAPFCLQVHYTAPHSPWDQELHPREVWNLYEGCQFKATPDLPPHPWQAPSAPRPNRGRTREGLLRGYYTAITAMDANIGRITQALQDKGLAEDTLVVFTSDNGMNLGQHGVWGKGNGTFPMNMYDSSVKVPAIFAWPGHVPAGKVVSSAHSHYDLIHTFAELAGVKWESEISLPGHSFARTLLAGEDIGEGHAVVCDEYGFVRMLREKDWKLVLRLPMGPNELYHLSEDPDETINLYDMPECAAVQRDMVDRLNKWFYRYVDPAMDGAHEGVTGAGQLCRPGIYANGQDPYRKYPKDDPGP